MWAGQVDRRLRGPIIFKTRPLQKSTRKAGEENMLLPQIVLIIAGAIFLS